MDIDLPIYGDDPLDIQATFSAVDQQPSEHSEVVKSSSSVAAPMRRKKRTTRVLPKDTQLELRNAEILDWNTNYLKNMKEAVHSKIQRRVQQQAKKNAEHYIWGAGIGGLGQDFFGACGPLDRFIGDNLFELLTGTSRNSKAKHKRDYNSEIEEANQGEARCKRQRTIEPEDETSRGQDDERLFMLGGDEEVRGNDEEVELPREAVSALDDQQIFSAMPWNISASKRGSSAIPHSGRVTMMSEQGRQGSRVGSRMVSASPLLRHSTGRIGEFKALQSLDSGALSRDEFAYAAPTSDPAEAERAVTEPSLRVREALSAEGENFFAFVADTIMEKRDRALNNLAEMPEEDQVGPIEVEQATFEELLPPPKTVKMIACQGFLMLLFLGMKGLLDVQQPTAYEDIILKLTDKAKAMQIVEVDDGYEAEPRRDENVQEVPAEQGRGEDEQDSMTEAGDDDKEFEPHDIHSYEQMVAGHAVAGDNDDHGSLYDSH
jgi:hypothetical protein